MKEEFYLSNKDLKGNKVLLRVDFNIPLDENRQVTDDTRIKAAIPTIDYILEEGGSLILMSHLGRPSEDNKERFSIKPVLPVLEKHLRHQVKFVEDTVGPDAVRKSKDLKPGEILLLENTRFDAGEKTGSKELAEKMASLADVYINDAFGTAHRAHASTAVVAGEFSPTNRGIGFLMEKEIKAAEKLLSRTGDNFILITGGAKVSDKIGLLTRFIDNVGAILIGGAMAYTFLKAGGANVGASRIEDDKLDEASQVLRQCQDSTTSIVLPSDSIAADAITGYTEIKEVQNKNIPAHLMGLDIGPDANTTFSQIIRSGKTIFWNGPMGVFEKPEFAKGTIAIAKAVVEATKNGAYSVVGGGDSVAALEMSGYADDVSHISTGGGAMLEYLEGKKLPGLAAIGV